MDKILRVNMTDLTVTDEPFPEEWKFLGGRGLSAKILLKEVDPTCDPLGPDNKVVLAPGVLSGSVAPTSGRMSVGGKSPLTNGIKEANSGGQAGQKMAKLGYRAMIIEGKARDPDKRYLVSLNKDGYEMVECPEIKGLRTYAAAEKLSQKFNDKTVFVLVGPAGEQGFSGASVALTDEGATHPARHAARGGLGAALGVKGLKAVAIDDSGTRPRQPQDMAAFKDYIKTFAKTFKEGGNIFEYGTSTTVPLANMMSTFPTRNRHEMQFEHADKLDGNVLVQNFEKRGGGMHHCMSGCIVSCSNVINNEAGEYVTSALEFETISLCGSNCCIGDLDKVAMMDRLCDELGLDTIETGGALGVAMDSGALEFGDADGAIALMEKIDKGDPLAEVIARGVVATAKHFNNKRVPAIGGQGIPAWEPRSLPATALSYMTGAMGADHTAGLVIAAGPDLAKSSQEAQLVNALCDSSGFCQFQGPTIENIRALYNAMYATDLTFEQVADLGWQCMQDEWAFNKKSGYDPTLPEWMRTEKVPSNDMTITVTDEDVARVFERMPVSDELRAIKAVG